MKKVLAIIITMAVVLSLVPVSVAMAGVGKDIKDMGDNGRHFQINIIGAQHAKQGDFDNPRRGTVFVKLNRQGAISTKINFEPNTADPNRFAVLDGNGWDDGQVTIAVPYEYYSTLSYNVYAIPLGKPNGSVHIEAEVTWGENATGILLMEDVDLFRNNGKPIVTDISDIFRSDGSYDPTPGAPGSGDEVTWNNVWVFNVPYLEDYYWTYENNKCKLVQLRFYETTSGSWGNAPE